MAIVDTVRRLIAKHGRKDGKLVRTSMAQTVLPSKPWAPEPNQLNPALSENLAVVVLDALSVLKPEQLMPEQTAVAYIDARIEPKALDVLTTKGKSYSVLRVEELSPGKTTLLYTLHLKGR